MPGVCKDREQAIAEGRLTYKPDKRCPYSHDCDRWVSTYTCMQCAENHKARYRLKPEQKAKNAAYARNRYIEKREEIKRKSIIHHTERMKTDINFKLRARLRERVAKALRRKTKDWSGIAEIGCTIDELWNYLEAKFTPEMTRENFGKVWVVDHIIPLHTITDWNSYYAKSLCHYTNLQPLTRLDNLKKVKSDLAIKKQAA